jgi:hypothetical protein
MGFFQFYKSVVDLGCLVYGDGVSSVSLFTFFNHQPLGGKIMITTRWRTKCARRKFSSGLFKCHCFKPSNNFLIATIHFHSFTPNIVITGATGALATMTGRYSASGACNR